MSGLFEIDALARRFRRYVEQKETLKPESARLLEEALIRGEFERGEIARVTGLPERTARRVLSDVVAVGLLHLQHRRVQSRSASQRSRLMCFSHACTHPHNALIYPGKTSDELRYESLFLAGVFMGYELWKSILSP